MEGLMNLIGRDGGGGGEPNKWAIFYIPVGNFVPEKLQTYSTHMRNCIFYFFILSLLANQQGII